MKLIVFDENDPKYLADISDKQSDINEFAKNMANKSYLNYGQNERNVNPEKYIKDHGLGKIGEFGVERVINNVWNNLNWDIKLKTDLNIYDRIYKSWSADLIFDVLNYDTNKFKIHNCAVKSVREEDVERNGWSFQIGTESSPNKGKLFHCSPKPKGKDDIFITNISTINTIFFMIVNIENYTSRLFAICTRKYLYDNRDSLFSKPRLERYKNQKICIHKETLIKHYKDSNCYLDTLVENQK